MTDAEVVRTIRERLSGTFDIESLTLFGSRARGDARPDSDYDVLVVANTALPFIERQGIGLMALGDRPFSVDLLIYTADEAAKEETLLGSSVYWARREGKQLYAK